jgi:hypothetical protein
MASMPTVEQILEHFVDNATESSVLMLLKALAYPSQGGLGYRIELTSHRINIAGYSVDPSARVLTISTAGVLSPRGSAELADALRDAVEVDIFESRHGLLYRVGWGSTKVVVGLVETVVGVVGILVPEPSTTAGGLVLAVLGANSIGDGITQIAGARGGEGLNALALLGGTLGSTVAKATGGDPHTGELVGLIGFHLGSLAVGSVAAIRVLQVPGTAMIRTGLGGLPGGVGVGRMDLWYGVPLQQALRADNGALTILSINNNANQSILRFVVQFGRLYVNGRIVGVERVLFHESNWRVVVKGLLKLLWYGAKAGM